MGGPTIFQNLTDTLPTENKYGWGSVWSKMGIFKWVFCYVIVLPCSYQADMFSQLIRPFKWGTAWSSTSMAIGITASQSHDYQKSVLY